MLKGQGQGTGRDRTLAWFQGHVDLAADPAALQQVGLPGQCADLQCVITKQPRQHPGQTVLQLLVQMFAGRAGIPVLQVLDDLHRRPWFRFLHRFILAQKGHGYARCTGRWIRLLYVPYKTGLSALLAVPEYIFTHEEPSLPATCSFHAFSRRLYRGDPSCRFSRC